jgi:hypothetical protein
VAIESRREISAELAAAGYLDERGKPFNPKIRSLDAGGMMLGWRGAVGRA